MRVPTTTTPTYRGNTHSVALPAVLRYFASLQVSGTITCDVVYVMSCRATAAGKQMSTTAKTAKRSRNGTSPPPDTSEYRTGAICRIKLTNFMTYDVVELHPGPALNVIVGFNGQQKHAPIYLPLQPTKAAANDKGRGKARSFVQLGLGLQENRR